MLAPFRGVRYAPERVSGLAEVTSPPYDVVGAAALERLRDADPHNVVRLTLPADAGEPGGRSQAGERDRPEKQDQPGGERGRSDRRYRGAGRTLCRWLAEGVLVPDTAAGLYVYEDRPEDNTANTANTADAAAASAGPRAGLQRGLIGALALSPPRARIVLPHEDVTAVVVADRRQLMEATEANLEPIFLLYEGGGAASKLVDEVTAAQEPLVEAVTDDGVTHRLWSVTEPARLASVAADLAARHAMIADGHHRYAAYLDLQARRHAEGRGPGPWDYGMALLVDSSAYPPSIGPIHRVIPGLPPAVAVERATPAFSVRTLPRATDLPTALRALADAGGQTGRSQAGRSRTAFVLAGAGEFHVLTDPDPAQLDAAMPAGHSDRWRGLDTSVLHELLIRVCWQIGDDAAAVRMIHHDAKAAIEAAGPAGTAILCNPLPVADVLAVAAAGERVLRKSTSFRPKPRTGLVIRSFAYG